jgi:SOS-response transcriptional repressor LexA
LKPHDQRAALSKLRDRVKRGVDISVPGGLTTKQAVVLLFCRTQVMLTGKMPTVREVQTEFNVSSLSTAQFHLENLREKGFLPRDRHDLYLTLTEADFLFAVIDEKDEQIRILAARVK